MFALTLHHRPEMNRRKGEKEFSCLILYESGQESLVKAPRSMRLDGPPQPPSGERYD
jgi:hypothetical protein